MWEKATELRTDSWPYNSPAWQTTYRSNLTDKANAKQDDLWLRRRRCQQLEYGCLSTTSVMSLIHFNGELAWTPSFCLEQNCSKDVSQIYFVSGQLGLFCCGYIVANVNRALDINDSAPVRNYRYLQIAYIYTNLHLTRCSENHTSKRQSCLDLYTTQKDFAFPRGRHTNIST